MNPAANAPAALAGTYRLLARLWLREVDQRLLSDLLRPPLCDAFIAAGGSLPGGPSPAVTSSAEKSPAETSSAEKSSGQVDPETLEELAVDYCQLFVGPAGHLPPYQSVWQSGQFQSKPAERMQQYAAAAGYETGGVMYDHLGVQFDVMGRLLDSGRDSGGRSRDVPRLAAAYFAEHLTWAAPLLELAGKRAATEFYRSIIRLTRDFLQSEQEFWDASLR